MAGRFEKPQAALAEADFIALGDGYVRELRASPRTNVDLGACAGRQLAVTGNEIRMQMGLDHVLDAQVVLKGGFQVDLDIALRVNHRCNAFRSSHI
jgi:hypothetical protein